MSLLLCVVKMVAGLAYRTGMGASLDEVKQRVGPGVVVRQLPCRVMATPNICGTTLPCVPPSDSFHNDLPLRTGKVDIRIHN